MKRWQAELVQVIDERILIGTNKQAFPYRTRYGAPLDAGYYLLLRHAGQPHQYRRGVVFFGPFTSENQADTLLHSSRYLGLLTGERALTPAHATTPTFVASARHNISTLPVLLRRPEHHAHAADKSVRINFR